MPPGSRHAVATIDSSDKDSNPAILQGFFFDSRYGMRRMLGAMVEYAVWHTQWSNVLYEDRFKLLAFLLDWHARSSSQDAKFVGQDLHAVLFAARHSQWLEPLFMNSRQELREYDPRSLPDSHGIHNFLVRRANQLLQVLPTSEVNIYRALETEFKNYIDQQLKAFYECLHAD